VSTNLFQLPFDQYQRYRLVADLLTASGHPPDTVVEVGGGVESMLPAFLGGTRVVIADVETTTSSANVSYVYADARGRLPFRDGAFDAAVTIDMLEHIARETRTIAVRELRRIATGRIVIACPVASPEAITAELAVDACYRAVFGSGHRWLAEHIVHGLPGAREIEDVLTSLGGAWCRYDNGYLPEWQVLMLLHLLFDEMPGGALGVPAIRAVDALYNERLYPYSNRGPAYRAVWVHVPRGEELPSLTIASGDAAPAADRAAFDAALRAAVALLPDRERLLADVERLQRDLAAVVDDRERVIEDRSHVERLRHEASEAAAQLGAEVERLRTEVAALRTEYRRAVEDRDMLASERRAWIAECEYLQRRSRTLGDERTAFVAELERLREEAGNLRWRLGRLGPLDRLASVVAPVVRPVLAPMRGARRDATPPPAEPYGREAQLRLAGSADASAPASVRVSVVIRAEHRGAEAVACTAESVSAQTTAPIEVRDDGEVDDLAGTHVAFVLAGDRLAPNALAEVAAMLAECPDATVVYSDEDTWTPQGRRNPELKPDWDPELARSAGYLGAFACFRRDLLAGVPADLSTGELRYALTLAAAERDERLARHVPRVLCHTDPANRDRERFDPNSPAARSLLATHLHRCGDDGEVVPAAPGLRIRRPVAATTAASLIIPYRDGPDLTDRCVATLLARSGHENWELIFVDNGSTDPRAEAIVERLVRDHPGRVQVIRYPLPYNFSAMNNLAAARARGDVLVLINNDTEVLSDGWLEHLISLANRPAVGAVGALLFYPDGTIQHCGVVLGMGSWPGRPTGVAGLAMRGCRPDEVDPLLYAYDRRAGAVTAAFVAVRRDRYLAVGGLDETLRNDFNDVDLCLRLEAQGFRTLYTPHVRVTHYESITRSYRALDAREVELMFERWADRFAVDPHVSPHLDRTTMKPALALRPVPEVQP